MDFIINTIHKLYYVESICKNSSTRRVIPELAVLKPVQTNIRFTADLRGPNEITVTSTSSIPKLESLPQDVEGSTFFAILDLEHGY